MIESKEQVLGDFREKAQAFLAEPNFVTGIDLDDATVTLKRYVLSEMRNNALGNLLGRFHKPIREANIQLLSEMIAEVEAGLAEE
jgi:hypothetical protein